jgi:hypothetical protein
VQEIFEENKSEMLQGAIFWTPMLATDSLDSAEERETRFSDPRVQHYWDPDRILGRLLSRTLNLQSPIAWDVYLVYPPDHSWITELPPSSEFWMHQLDEEPKLYLDSLRLKHNVRAMIEKLLDKSSSMS